MPISLKVSAKILESITSLYFNNNQKIKNIGNGRLSVHNKFILILLYYSLSIPPNRVWFFSSVLSAQLNTAQSIELVHASNLRARVVFTQFT